MKLSIQKLKFAAVAAALSALLAACGGGGGGGGSTSVCYSCNISQSWFDVYGRYCGGGNPRPGCNFYSNGDKILDVQDPYFSATYHLDYGTWYYNDSFGYSRSYYGWAWQSPTGVLYNDYGRALNQTEDEGRDIIGDVAEQQEQALTTVAEDLSARYQLSADVSMRVVRVLNDWAQIGKTRKRTEKDAADFTKRLYGVDVNTVNAALEAAQKGDMTAADKAIAQAAQNWSTSPDTMKQILIDWYGKQM